MLIDARHLENSSEISGDICIIGAGVAGISMALRLASTRCKVILLEGGGLEYDGRMQDLFRGTTTGQRYYPLRSTRIHAFGGTFSYSAGMCAPFEASVFARRDWVKDSGWQIDAKDLEPFYAEAHKVFGLGNDDFNIINWQQKYGQMDMLPLGGDVFFPKLWKRTPGSRNDFGETYVDSITASKNIDLYLYANVTNLHATKDLSAISSVVTRNYAGKNHVVRAKYFILATCAIQNARLLLASNELSEKGLGNENDLVGRYFMESAEVHSAELWLNERNSLKPYMWSSTPVNARVELALTERAQRENQILNGVISFLPMTVSGRNPSSIETWTSEDPLEDRDRVQELYRKAAGSRLERFLSKDRHKVFDATLRLEQAPNPRSRVTLISERDELGVPRVSLHWEFTEFEKRSLRKIYMLLGQVIGAAGLGRVRLLEDLWDERDTTMPPTTSGGWHHMGTTRMSDDPKKGVVNRDCRVHSISNLYVAGSSCFPNSGAVNPTYTLVALSLRLAEHLAMRFRLEH